MSNVFEGGVGSDSGGSDDKSIDSGVRDLEEEGLDDSGEFPADIPDVVGFPEVFEAALREASVFGSWTVDLQDKETSEG